MIEPRFNALLIHRTDPTPDLGIFRVEPEGWDLPEFTPGQFAILGLPGSAARCAGAEVESPPPPPPDNWIRRTYSMASSSKVRSYLEFFMQRRLSGALTPRLFQLRVGDRLWLHPRFFGPFSLEGVPSDSNVVLMATGTGLAPFVSMVRSHSAEGRWRRLAVLHGARHSRELAYGDEFEKKRLFDSSFSYIPILSRPQEEPTPWAGKVGYVQDLWTNRVLEDLWGERPVPATTHVLLCGSPAMIETMLRTLSAEGFRKHSRGTPGEVHVEKFQ